MHDLSHEGTGGRSMSTRLSAGLAAIALLAIGSAILLHRADRPASPPAPGPTPAATRPADPAGAARHPVGEPARVPERTQGDAGPAARQPAPRLGTGRHAVRADDFDSLLTAYDSLAGAELSAFRARYDGAISFGSREEFDWLASNGYPLPEEILDAAGKTLRELEAIAATGDEKAEALYFDRLNQELVKARQQHVASGMDPDTLMENPEFQRLFAAADGYRSRLADNASPFVGYLLSAFYETALRNPHAAAGALYRTGSRGDYVAMQAADRIAVEYGIGEEARDALAAYSLVLRDRDPAGYQPRPRPGR